MQISVIIPTYKPQAYLFKCLDSLASQTLDASLWEIILVLNGCKEPWLEQINQYLSTHPLTNLRLMQTDTPGVSNARNLGLDSAKGEYIAFIDDDDYVSPSYLEELLSHAAHDVVSLSCTKAFRREGEYITYYIEKEYWHYAPNGKQPFYRPKRYFGGPCMKLIHHSIIGNRRFDTRFSNGEDSLFMFTISDCVRYADFTSPKAVYYRRLRPGSAISSKKGWQTISNRVALMHAISAIYWKSPRKYLFRFYITRLIASIHAIITNF